MSGKPKSKKSSQAVVYDPDTPDSLVGALASEILAPENLNLLVPVTMFAVSKLSGWKRLILGCCRLFRE